MMTANVSSSLLLAQSPQAETSILTVNNSVVQEGAFSESGHRLQLTRYIVQRLLVPIITSFGLVGNVISICVLTRRSMLSSTNCYLTALAIFDTLYLIFHFSLSLNHYEDIPEADSYKYWYPYGIVLTDICSSVSVCLTVTFTLERYIGVCHPMKGRVICNPQRARLISLIVVIITTICVCPEFFERTVVKTKEGNKTIIRIEYTDLAESDSYGIGYNWFLSVTFTFLPLILLSSFNGLLIKSVFRASKLRERMAFMSMNRERGRHQGEQNRITLMLVSVAVVFLVCQFPAAILLLYKTYIQLEDITLTEDEYNDLRVGGNVVNLCVLINGSINFVLYSVMSTKFRKVFLRMFCKLIPKYRDSPNGTDLSNIHSGMYTRHYPYNFLCKRMNNNYSTRGSMRMCYASREVPRWLSTSNRSSARIKRGSSDSGYSYRGSFRSEYDRRPSPCRGECAWVGAGDSLKTNNSFPERQNFSSIIKNSPMLCRQEESCSNTPGTQVSIEPCNDMVNPCFGAHVDNALKSKKFYSFDTATNCDTQL